MTLNMFQADQRSEAFLIAQQIDALKGATKWDESRDNELYTNELLNANKKVLFKRHFKFSEQLLHFQSINLSFQSYVNAKSSVKSLVQRTCSTFRLN